MKHLPGLLIVCAACILPLRLVAADTVTESVRVSFAELDLKKEAGVRELYKRLQRASKRVCGTSFSAPRRLDREQDSCYQETLNSAVAQVGNPLLERIHGQS
ncbi:MAG: UrcA family protein [Gammaproteobacteria bacterium]